MTIKEFERFFNRCDFEVCLKKHRPDEVISILDQVLEELIEVNKKYKFKYHEWISENKKRLKNLVRKHIELNESNDQMEKGFVDLDNILEIEIKDRKKDR